MAIQSLTALADALRAARAAHAAKLEEVEQARLDYEERSRELARLEERIAELEREAREAGPADDSPRAQAGAGLRAALLIVNPHSGVMANGGQLLDEIRERLRANGIAAEVGLRKSAR